MNEYSALTGFLEVYKVKANGDRELMWAHKNTIGSALTTACAALMYSRSVNQGVDAIAWGSYRASAGTFVDSDWAGTTSSGTKGSLIMSLVGTNKAKFSGTFSFSTTKYINFFQLGIGYVAAAAGVTALFTTIYNYDRSLLLGSTSLQYDNGETLIVNWTTQFGS